VVSGLPGTGKSYFTARLAEKAEFAVLESDALRKVLFTSPDYSPNESSRLFRAVHALIKRMLDRGIPMVLDATTLSEAHREQLYSIAERTGARLVLVEVTAPPELVYSRLEKRRSMRADRLDSSDADWEVYLRMKPAAERIGRGHYSVDTSQDIAPVIDRVLREIAG
jgi:predicted kinase